MTLNQQVALSPVHRENFQIAWRVLTQFNAGEVPAVDDIRRLKQSMGSSNKRLRVDDLACAVMRRELEAGVA
jgi:hypothetical protein